MIDGNSRLCHGDRVMPNGWRGTWSRRLQMARRKVACPANRGRLYTEIRPADVTRARRRRAARDGRHCGTPRQTCTSNCLCLSCVPDILHHPCRLDTDTTHLRGYATVLFVSSQHLARPSVLRLRAVATRATFHPIIDTATLASSFGHQSSATSRVQSSFYVALP